MHNRNIPIEDDATARWLKEFVSLERNWEFPTLTLRRNFDYFRTLPGSRKLHSREIFLRLQSALDNDLRSWKCLDSLLTGVRELVADAVENSLSDAHAAWDKHEVWLSVIDEGINANEEPALMLVESIYCLGGSDSFSTKNLCAAIGLWCFGEYHFVRDQNNLSEALRLLEQAAIALAEAELHCGQELKEKQTRRALSNQNKAAADASHERHRKIKLDAFNLWTSRAWRVQADAEREIAKDCKIVQAVAGRWIREFKRSPDAYRALQSKHSAMRRP